MLDVEAPVRKAVLYKIEETLSSIEEISKIGDYFEHMPMSNKEDFLFGIAIGRIFNSFHYQTRRALKRNATKAEIGEFLEMVSIRAEEIRNALKQQ